MAELPAITPMPQVADCVLPWDGPVSDTVAAIGAARSACGNTFVIDGGEDRYLFDFTRRLGHRMGLASWGGRETLRSDRFEELIEALDVLDGSEAFVAPARMREVAQSGKAAEYAAMAKAEQILAESIASRREPLGDLLDTILERWADVPDPERLTGVARDVILVHLGSMSNLFAALGWSLVHLVQHPDVLARVRASHAADHDLVSRCVLESTRIGQRSIMLRTVLEPVTIDDGSQTYEVSPGASLATFLPLTNMEAGPGLDRYDPDRWRGPRLVSPPGLPSELVITFGVGPHACPARPFSVTAMSRVIERLFDAFELEPRFDDPKPRPDQIGGVARAADPCQVVVRAR